jgi:hypothetical protein
MYEQKILIKSKLSVTINYLAQTLYFVAQPPKKFQIFTIYHRITAIKSPQLRP